MSGTTFFTLGFGDVTPADPLGRMLAVAEAGIGFAFLASIIGYLPVLYAAFSRREIAISLLDASAGSPPSAAEGLLRVCADRPARQGDAPVRGMGALGRRGAREPPVVPGAAATIGRSTTTSRGSPR